METTPLLSFVISGNIRRETILLPDGTLTLDIPGGSGLYSAVGARLWSSGIGLIGRVGEDYPQDWLTQFRRLGFDIRGIKILPHILDVRSFFAYPTMEVCETGNPVSHFARLGLPFPKILLGFPEITWQMDSRTKMTDYSIRQNDFPADYLDASAAHICPMDYLSQTLLPSVFRQGHISTVTIDPGAGYMNPNFWDDLPVVLRGVSAIITNEEKITALFHGRSTDLWEMAEGLAAMGTELVIIQRRNGQYLYDATAHTRWQIPAFPARLMDPTGAEDAFCGGFLVGLRTTYSPVEAALYGNISASFVMEGSGPFYALDVLPGLPVARLEALRSMIRRV